MSNDGGLWDVFVKDVVTGAIELASVNSSGEHGDGSSCLPMLSRAAAHVAFASFRPTWQRMTRTAAPTFCARFRAQNAAVDVALRALAVGNSLGTDTLVTLFIGLRDVAIPTPWDGTLLVLPICSFTLAVPAGGAALPASIPCDSLLRGARGFLQATEIDPGASHGIAFSRGLAIVIGAEHVGARRSRRDLRVTRTASDRMRAALA